MKTIKCNTQADINEALANNVNPSLNLIGVKEKRIKLTDAIAGYIDLTNATVERIDSTNATVERIDLTDATAKRIDLTDAKAEIIDLRGTTAKCIDLTDAKARRIDLTDAKVGIIDLTDATAKCIDLTRSKIDRIIKNYTLEEIEFLRSLPMGIIDMKSWQSNKNWKECSNEKELHECGTTYCVRGYAEAQYLVKHGRICLDNENLYPGLKHFFYMSNEEFRKHRNLIIN